MVAIAHVMQIQVVNEELNKGSLDNLVKEKRGSLILPLFIESIKFEYMNYISLNPEYVLKPDKGRALILTKDVLRTELPVVESVIHPIHAMILSFFDGTKTIEETVSQIITKLEIEKELIIRFITPIIENDHTIGVNITENDIIVFPIKTLIYSDMPILREKYDYSLFYYDNLNLRTDRHFTPSRITFMATTRCYTNCIYCYANRRTDISPLPFDRVRDIIQEAKELRVVSFDVIGGEFFLYKYWKEMLQLLLLHNYTPFISTKVPISRKDIEFLKQIGVKDIQVSLDTLIPEHSVKLLSVKESYINGIKETLRLLCSYGIEVQIHTILTSINSTINDMDSIYRFISNLDYIRSWKIDVAASTLYKSESSYINIKSERDDLRLLVDYFESLKKANPKIKIISGDIDIDNNPNPNELSSSQKLAFFSHKRDIFCAANYSSLFILPDGKVTICEELYWNPQFIIGDCKENKISEIWNSSIAKSLYYLSLEQIQEKSPCKKCSIFTKCRQEYGGVCWREVIKAYGNENWDYPDPRCPKAESVTKKIYI